MMMQPPTAWVGLADIYLHGWPPREGRAEKGLSTKAVRHGNDLPTQAVRKKRKIKNKIAGASRRINRNASM